MRYLNTVYVRNHRARVQCRRGSLLVTSPEESRRIPLESVDAMVLLGGAQLTTQALDACTRRGVRVAALTRGGAVRFTVNGATSGNVHLRTALFETVADATRSLQLAKAIVAAKLQNSHHVVDRWARDTTDPELRRQLAGRAAALRTRVARVAEATTGDGIRGVEGDAARVYFRAVAKVLATTELPFSARTRRPPRDPVNAALGFCYGLMVTEFIGALESVGLDYQMGFFHRPRSGRPSLALDLAEELRSLTDRFVVTMVRRRQLRPDKFEETPGGAVYLSDDGRTKLIQAWEEHKDTELHHRLLGRDVGRWALPSVQATLLARHLRGDLPDYPPCVLP